MSFEINWDKLILDDDISLSIKHFLDQQFKSIELPSYIAGLSVTNFSLGSEAPEITIRHIGDPFDQFYEENDDEYSKPVNTYDDSSSDDELVINDIIDSFTQRSSTPLTNLNMIGVLRKHNETPISILKNHDYIFNKPSPKSDNDIQFIVEINYVGNLELELTVNLLVNYPSPNFISLPIKLHVTDMVIHSIAAIAYMKNSVYFSFLCDINDHNSDFYSDGGNFTDYIHSPQNNARIDIIKKIKIESEIGEVENNVLRNVGKIERFLTDQLRKILRDEIAWPSWVCFDLNDDDEEEES